jgi:hypothetical protein
VAGGRVVVDGYKETLNAIRAFDPALRRALTKELREEASGILTDAKSNASWSSRIPSALALSVTSRDVSLRVKRAKAPHGPLFERGSRGNRSTIRHPVFGHREVWVSQPSRPFLQPAVDQNRAAVVAAVVKAVEQAARKAGL